MSTSLYMDLSNGISGDMFLAAAAGLGVDLKALEDIFVRAGVQVDLELSEDKRCGITGNRVNVRADGQQPLRRLPDIEELVLSLECSQGIKEKTIEAFRRLAKVEAGVHGVCESDIHFHETGAVDTVVDILGAFWAVNELKAEVVLASSLPWICGSVSCEHGVLPLPAPATVELMRDKPVLPVNIDFEAVTPTGALVVDQLVQGFAAPQGRLQKSGVGFGKMDKGFNGLRLFLFSLQEDQTDWVWVLQSNVDHLSGEEIGVFIREMQKAGALDSVYLPGVMKKNRPGGMLQVLCAPQDLEKIREAFYRHSLTLGIREQLVRRSTLQRKAAVRSMDEGNLAGKSFYLKGREFWRPEMDEVIKKAREAGVTVAEFLNRLRGR